MRIGDGQAVLGTAYSEFVETGIELAAWVKRGRAESIRILKLLLISSPEPERMVFQESRKKQVGLHTQQLPAQFPAKGCGAPVERERLSPNRGHVAFVLFQEPLIRQAVGHSIEHSGPANLVEGRKRQVITRNLNEVVIGRKHQVLVVFRLRQPKRKPDSRRKLVIIPLVAAETVQRQPTVNVNACFAFTRLKTHI